MVRHIERRKRLDTSDTGAGVHERQTRAFGVPDGSRDEDGANRTWRDDDGELGSSFGGAEVEEYTCVLGVIAVVVIWCGHVVDDLRVFDTHGFLSGAE